MEPTMEAGLEPAGGMKPVAGPVVQIDEGHIQAHVDEVVRATVEGTFCWIESCRAIAHNFLNNREGDR